MKPGSRRILGRMVMGIPFYILFALIAYFVGLIVAVGLFAAVGVIVAVVYACVNIGEGIIGDEE